jgi:hypothetical protein
MKKSFLVLVFVLMTRIGLLAQGAATFHVFPQIADGALGDGTAYVTSVNVTNVSTQPATCTVKFYGVPPSRLGNTPLTTTIVSQGSVFQWSTSGNGILATGYATLTCNQSVTASAVYVQIQTSNSVVIAGATVFSSPPTMRAHLGVTELASVHTALALVNDTDGPGQYQVTVTDVGIGLVKTATITLPPRSNLPKFLNQIVELPGTFSGTVVVTSTTTQFSLVGLVFINSIFISQPASIY